MVVVAHARRDFSDTRMFQHVDGFFTYNLGVADWRYERLNMPVRETSIDKAWEFSTYFFHTLIKQHLLYIKGCRWYWSYGLLQLHARLFGRSVAKDYSLVLNHKLLFSRFQNRSGFWLAGWINNLLRWKYLDRLKTPVVYRIVILPP